MKRKVDHQQLNVREVCLSIAQALTPDYVSKNPGFFSGDDETFLGAFLNAPKTRDGYIVKSLLSKSDFLDLGIDRAAVALQSFYESDLKCQDTNAMFSTPGFWSKAYVAGTSAGTARMLLRRKIAKCLGRFSWDIAVRSFGFGPGAAVGVPRRRAHPAYKVGAIPTVTQGCLELGVTTLKWFDLWGRLHDGPEVVAGNKIVTVPKSYKTDRVIAIEPLLNSFIQKGIGKMIRRRLRAVGVNLNDQTRNQVLAREGSESGVLATLDLKSASDSVSRWLVYELLPRDWFQALDLARSPRGTLPSGEIVTYQKFSSMGNGYTFELESLIFWAILSVCRDIYGEKDDTISVYGDDLIVPTKWASVAIEWLQFFGFTTNLEKSFLSGDFRESCGKHYSAGVDWTPLYIRKDVASPERLVWLANSIRRLANRLGSGYFCDARLKGVYDQVVSFIPEWARRDSIPDGYGDGALVRDLDEACPRPASPQLAYFGWEGWVTHHHVRFYRNRRGDGGLQLVAKLLETEGKSVITDAFVAMHRDGSMSARKIRSLSYAEPQGAKYRWLRKRLVVKQWRDLGPWI